MLRNCVWWGGAYLIGGERPAQHILHHSTAHTMITGLTYVSRPRVMSPLRKLRGMSGLFGLVWCLFVPVCELMLVCSGYMVTRALLWQLWVATSRGDDHVSSSERFYTTHT